MFHDINELIIVFHQKNNIYGPTTANYNFKMNSLSVASKQQTKKVFINYNNNKKTKRKELKGNYT